ncbi:MAG TPA: hypothetical protein VJJ98_09760 [Sedimentisphaerales bacterium]|nr:hypothetical protein [Sedimentisphaerales bacterium]
MVEISQRFFATRENAHRQARSGRTQQHVGNNRLHWLETRQVQLWGGRKAEKKDTLDLRFWLNTKAFGGSVIILQNIP